MNDVIKVLTSNILDMDIDFLKELNLSEEQISITIEISDYSPKRFNFMVKDLIKMGSFEAQIMVCDFIHKEIMTTFNHRREILIGQLKVVEEQKAYYLTSPLAEFYNKNTKPI